jgi:hypothetical protein
MPRDHLPPPLVDDDELLFHQVHPNDFRDGRVVSSAFNPSKDHDFELSVAQETMTTPEGAYLHHTEKLKRASKGTWAVTVGEARAEQLAVYPDPIPPPPDAVPDPAHAIIDFRPVSSGGQRKAKAMLLARKATTRGRLHPPPTPSEAPPEQEPE